MGARRRVKIGPKRSPIRTPQQAAAFAREILRRPRLKLVGLMAYEGHIKLRLSVACPAQ